LPPSIIVPSLCLPPSIITPDLTVGHSIPRPLSLVTFKPGPLRL
jgi:hypothetical protein